MFFRATCKLGVLALSSGVHCYLKLTEVPLLLCDVPTLDLCLGKQRSSTPVHPVHAPPHVCAPRRGTSCEVLTYCVD